VLFPKDIFRIKHHRKVWGKVDLPPYPYSLRLPDTYYRDMWLRYPQFPYYVLDTEPEFMSLEDQREEAAGRIAELDTYQFLCRPAIREGVVSSSVFPITIAQVDPYQFPDLPRISEVRSLLAAQSGIPAGAIRKELGASLPPERRDRARTSSGQPRHKPQQMPPPQTPQPVPADAAQATPSLPTQRRYRVS
jgi:hypothetical protein